MTLDVLFEDNHCLAVNKPAGLLTQGDSTGEPNLVDEARAYLKEKYAKPGDAFIGLVHRLDRPTSGVVMLARTSKAAGRISEQFRAGTIEKIYWAIVEGRPPADSADLVDTLFKDEFRNFVSVVPGGTSNGSFARLKYQVLERYATMTLLEVRPHTGRSHQIRVQLASRSLPVMGDHKYGARSRMTATDGGHRIALHAHRLTFRHPTRGGVIALNAPVPPDWLSPATANSRGRPTG